VSLLLLTCSTSKEQFRSSTQTSSSLRQESSVLLRTSTAIWGCIYFIMDAAFHSEDAEACVSVRGGG
jgi:hypothetical protein